MNVPKVTVTFECCACAYKYTVDAKNCEAHCDHNRFCADPKSLYTKSVFLSFGKNCPACGAENRSRQITREG